MKAGRKPLPPGRRRVSRTVSIARDTELRIIQAAEAKMLSIGQVIDSLAENLPLANASE